KFPGHARRQIEKIRLGILHAPLPGQFPQLLLVSVTHHAMDGPDDGRDAEEAEEKNSGREAEHQSGMVGMAGIEIGTSPGFIGLMRPRASSSFWSRSLLFAGLARSVCVALAPGWVPCAAGGF